MKIKLKNKKINIHLAFAHHFRYFLKIQEMKSSQKTCERMIIAFLVIVMKCSGRENIQQMSISTITLKHVTYLMQWNTSQLKTTKKDYIQVTTWKHLENIMLSKSRQTQKVTYCPFI